MFSGVLTYELKLACSVSFQQDTVDGADLQFGQCESLLHTNEHRHPVTQTLQYFLPLLCL